MECPAEAVVPVAGANLDGLKDVALGHYNVLVRCHEDADVLRGKAGNVLDLLKLGKVRLCPRVHVADTGEVCGVGSFWVDGGVNTLGNRHELVERIVFRWELAGAHKVVCAVTHKAPELSRSSRGAKHVRKVGCRLVPLGRGDAIEKVVGEKLNHLVTHACEG